jgi:DNA-binding MarR family transcriptional regulator
MASGGNAGLPGTELPGQVLGRLFRLAPALAGLSERGSKEYGLTYARGRVLSALHASGPMVMRALSDALGVSPTTVTGLVDALEADGWVARRPHPTDRRATIIEMTPFAAETFGKLEQAYRGFATLLMNGISTRDLQRVLAVIDQIQARLDDAIPQAQAAFDLPAAVPGKVRDH